MIKFRHTLVSVGVIGLAIPIWINADVPAGASSNLSQTLYPGCVPLKKVSERVVRVQPDNKSKPTLVTRTVYRSPSRSGSDISIDHYSQPISLNHLSNHDIAFLGFPLKPATGSARSSWNSRYAQKPLRTSSSDAAPCINGTSVPAAYPSLNGVTSPNWSGRLNLSTSAGYYKEVTGRATIPHFQRSACPTPSAHAIWVGIGGWNSGSLIQAGIDVNANSDTVFPWIEHLTQNNPSQSEGEIRVSNPPVNPGDTLDISVVYGANGQVTYSFFNVTTGVTGLAHEAVIPATYDGTSVEWVDERTLINNKYAYFRKITDNTTWRYEGANNKSIDDAQPSNVAEHIIIMKNAANKTLGIGFRITGVASSQDYWAACS